MKTRIDRSFTGFSLHRSGGMTMLDVLLAIVIFVIGMLALASLQGNLTRSNSDANARTMGTNLAERLIERYRTFETLRTEAGLDAYQDIVSETLAFNDVSGIDYSVDVTVDDWYFMPDGVTLTKVTGDLPDDTDTTISDFKYVQLDVSWASPEFQVYGANDVQTSTLGSGALTVSSIIPSIVGLGTAKIAADDDGNAEGPPVLYTPGARPDIVAIDLDGSKFKESLTPMPDVIRTDELVETWFDVVTYNNANNAIFLRREEFLIVTCECELHSKPGDGSGSGFPPTVWDGVEYQTGSDGAMISKAYGTSANNQQSQYCDTCCRDHHDPDQANPDSDDVYDPARINNQAPFWSESGGLDRDHKHYTRANRGGLSVAGDGDTYVEACRMVRKDGFMRVAQDFRQEGSISFPEGYLDTQSGVETYSDYVTDAVTDFYAENRDALTPPSGNVEPPGTDAAWSYDFPADKINSGGTEDLTDTTDLPLLGLDSQQMRSRGIYIDNQSDELKLLLACLAVHAAEAVPGDSCGAPGVDNPVQVLPFYDIQTTWLAWWNSLPAGDPVSVTNEGVRDNNTHSRGLAVLEDPTATSPQVEVDTSIHRGNIGLTVTDPITEADTAEDNDGNVLSRATHMLYMDLNGGGGTGSPSVYTFTGTFGSSVNQVDASDATITELANTFCSRAGTNLACVTPLGEAGGIEITDYVRKQGQNWIDYFICIDGFPTGTVLENFPGGINNRATINWPASGDVTNISITIEEATCN